MKTLVALCCFLVIVRAQVGMYLDASVDIQDDISECLDVAGLTIEEVARLMAAKEEVWERPEMQQVFMKTGCFLACAYQKDGEMDGPKMIVSKMHEELDKWHKSMDACAERVEEMTDECDVALLFTTCMMDYM